MINHPYSPDQTIAIERAVQYITGQGLLEALPSLEVVGYSYGDCERVKCSFTGEMLRGALEVRLGQTALYYAHPDVIAYLCPKRTEEIAKFVRTEALKAAGAVCLYGGTCSDSALVGRVILTQAEFFRAGRAVSLSPSGPPCLLYPIWAGLAHTVKPEAVPLLDFGYPQEAIEPSLV